jgi:two-component system, chemotaxis family, chemotaxis protein CheY
LQKNSYFENYSILHFECIFEEFMAKFDDLSLLITDDSIIARKKIKGLLKDMGFKISEAVSGKEALEAMEIEKFDLLLLDLLMPEIDGFEVLRHLKENNISMPIIVISADIQEATKELCLELGASGFLNKPPSQSELVSAIEEVLSK